MGAVRSRVVLIVIEAGAGSTASGCSTTSGASLPASNSELRVSSGEEKVCGFAWKKRNSAVLVAISATTSPVSARGYPNNRLPRASIGSEIRSFGDPTQPRRVTCLHSGYASDTHLRHPGYNRNTQTIAGFDISLRSGSRANSSRTIPGRTVPLLFSSFAAREDDPILGRHLVVGSASGPRVNPASPVANENILAGDGGGIR